MRTKKILLIALFCVTVTGCEKWEKWEIPVWSSANRFHSQLNRLECEDARVSIKEEEWNLDIEKEISIVGTWKLLLDLSTGDTIDRSCTSAYYTFHADGTVEIESEIKEIPSGTFAYEYYTDPYCPWCDPVLSPRPNLIIGENEYFCQVSPSWLVTFFVSYWDVDGEIQTTRSRDVEKVFRRIN